MPHEPKKKHSKAAKRTRRAAVTLKYLGLHQGAVAAVNHSFAKAESLGIAKHQPKKNKAVVTRA